MIVIGIDPGSRTTGFGVVSSEGNRARCIDFGTVSMPAKTKSGPIQHRLSVIYSKLCELFEKYQPDRIAVEGVFYATNVKSALVLGHVRGVVLLAATIRNIEIAEFSPLEVKKAVAGYGRADKQQVQHMVKTLLNLTKEPSPYDASDALAIALCCVFNGGQQKHSQKSWRKYQVKDFKIEK